MIDNYTREANERCFKLAQSDVDEVFRDIAATDADTDADRWKKKTESHRGGIRLFRALCAHPPSGWKRCADERAGRRANGRAGAL